MTRIVYREEQEEQCSICFEQLIAGKPKSQIFKCHNLHEMHEDCASEWVLGRKNSGLNVTCPVCRSEANEQHIYFIGADSSNANFAQSNLSDINFYGANLTRVNFDHANLTGLRH